MSRALQILPIRVTTWFSYSVWSSHLSMEQPLKYLLAVRIDKKWNTKSELMCLLPSVKTLKIRLFCFCPCFFFQRKWFHLWLLENGNPKADLMFIDNYFLIMFMLKTWNLQSHFNAVLALLKSEKHAEITWTFWAICHQNTANSNPSTPSKYFI